MELLQNENGFNDDVCFLENKFNDYKKVVEFFSNITERFFDDYKRFFNCTIGICNDTQSQFFSLFSDISKLLMDGSFNSVHYNYNEHYINKNVKEFVSTIKYIQPNKKYYSYSIPKELKFERVEKYSYNDKIRIINELFNDSLLSESYDINIYAPVSYITVRLIQRSVGG